MDLLSLSRFQYQPRIDQSPLVSCFLVFAELGDSRSSWFQLAIEKSIHLMIMLMMICVMTMPFVLVELFIRRTDLFHQRIGSFWWTDVVLKTNVDDDGTLNTLRKIESVIIIPSIRYSGTLFWVNSQIIVDLLIWIRSGQFKSVHDSG